MVQVISGNARRELVRAIGERYRSGTRDEKRRILDELVAVTGWHRKHATRTLNQAPSESATARRQPRSRVRDDATRQALLVLWEAPDRDCGKRLKTLLPSRFATTPVVLTNDERMSSLVVSA